MEREHRNLFFYEGVIISFDPGENPDFTKLTIYGKSTQDGTPAPDAPAGIVSVGDDGSLAEVVTGKNMCNHDATVYSAYFDANGVWRLSDDSASIRIPCIPNQTYTVSLNSESGLFRVGVCNTDKLPTSTSYVQLDPFVRRTTNDPITISTGKDAKYLIIQLGKGTFAEKIRTCQIEFGQQATNFEPFQGYTTATLTTGLPLYGIPVTSGGNVTIEGQQYIADTLEINADGSGKVVKRCAKVLLNQLSFTNSWGVKGGEYAHSSTTLKGMIVSPESASSVPKCYCSSYKPVSSSTLWSKTYQYGISIMSDGTLLVYDSRYTTTNHSDFSASLGDAYLIYLPATPEEIPLTTAEVQAVLNFQTFAPMTNVCNDEGAWQKLEGILWEADV